MKQIVGAASGIFLLACGGTSEQIESAAETAYDRQIKVYLEDKPWTALRQENGLYVYKERVGEGRPPQQEDYLTLKYEGRLLDGTVFDGNKTDTVTFPFPVKDLIKGWREGIPHFKKGGKGTLIVPPDLGYGDRETPQIPANSVLVFDIELIDYSAEPPSPKVDRSVDYSSAIEAYLSKKGWVGFEKTASGLYVKVEVPGSKKKPTVKDYLTLNYEGYLLNGASFDGTSGTAITFPFPMSNLILGWQEGLPYFGKGGKGTLVIPPYLGYGDRETPQIPANSVLVFDIELIDFTAVSPQKDF